MGRKRQDIINDYLANPQKLLLKKPFLRGTSSLAIKDSMDGNMVKTNAMREAVLPKVYKNVVSQERFARELDPNCHSVIFDENLPSICVKEKDTNNYLEIKFKKFGIAFQRRIMEKSTLCLCGNKRVHILHDPNPSEELKRNFADFKWHWEETNQDGIETHAVSIQQSYGDVGLLVYMNEKNEVKTRLFSYADGYQVISHRDDNGEPLIDCVYYRTEDGVRHIDAYDDVNHYHFSNSVPADTAAESTSTWHLDFTEEHGFTESPLVTKRGDVPWNNVQDLIEPFRDYL